MTDDLINAATESPTRPAPAPRPPPRVVLVPPRCMPDTYPVVAFWGGVLLVLLGAFLFVEIFPGRGSPVSRAISYAMIIPVGLGPLLAIGTWHQARRMRRERNEFLAAHPTARDDRLVAALDGQHSSRDGLDVESARTLVEESVATGAPPVDVVCLGIGEVPEVGHRPFEPHIITATELLWRRLPLLLVPVGILALWFCEAINVAPRLSVPLGPSLGGWSIGIGVSIGATWLLRAGLYPTYVRLAPGLVEFMTYPLFGLGKPQICSYPMDGGTLAIVARVEGETTLTIGRSDQVDTLNISRARHRDVVLERVWWALLSTAPIPRLSTESLVE